MKKELDEETIEDDLEEDAEEEEDEESELEEPLTLEEPKLNLDFNSLNFDQFTPPVEITSSGSPVLENIESRVDRPTFVQTGFGSGASGSSSNSVSGRDDTYLPDQAEDNGPKYIQSGGEIKTDVGRVDMQSLGRGSGGFNIPQQDFFISSESNFQSTNVEQIGTQLERVDMQNIGRQNPLEGGERKYEKHEKYEFKS